jgi:hypothetical protein
VKHIERNVLKTRRIDTFDEIGCRRIAINDKMPIHIRTDTETRKILIEVIIIPTDMLC